ncbi:hypothetical protein DBR43_16810 [Pedobacter sp. KBW06]|uniref:hypothetical protein n=1 Tax=Pedobacter sp. KBW06 TaxID=2153359 RepID=UPI000F592773|nr:hypothetical protein [Pedobacter sp. KBW06]RQO69723.1 hypothetical protein DBR43_16810 [Pedobacter sp. KBW06]
MSRHNLLVLLGWNLALVLLANLRLLTKGESDWRIYAFLSVVVVVVVGAPLIIGVGAFVLYIVIFIVNKIKQILEWYTYRKRNRKELIWI